MKTKNLVCLITFFICISAFAQEEKSAAGTINIYFGIKTRVTPIPLKRTPDFIHLGNVDVLEQPDMHLSGPGLSLSAKIFLKNNWSVLFNQTTRYDYIYQRLPLSNPEPPGFKATIRKKIILDFYTDFKKDFPSNKQSFFSLLMGLGACGFNSDFDQTIRAYTSQTNYRDYIVRKNFVFPSVSTGVGWQWKNAYVELKFGYCWNDPTIFNTPFVFPEANFQYNISSLFKKKERN